MPDDNYDGSEERAAARAALLNSQGAEIIRYITELPNHLSLVKRAARQIAAAAKRQRADMARLPRHSFGR